MKKINKKRLWIGILVLIVIVLSQLVSSCLQFRMSTSRVKKEFQEKELRCPEIISVKVDNRNVNYAYLDNEKDNLVVFVHGAPGSWSAFVDFFKDSTLNGVADIISLDRPGYGYSDFGKPDTSLESQAHQLAEALKGYADKRKIWVGHSLGGPVVARIAMDYPNMVQGMILVAPSIAPEEEKQEWYRPWLRTKIAKFLLPTTFWVTNEEIFFLKAELLEMLPHWSELVVPTLVIQGGKDNLVPPGNADFARRMISPDYLTVWREEDMNHFVPWTHPHLIYNGIYELIKKYQ